MWLRVCGRGGIFAYRGLFAFISPGMYVAVMLGSPVLQIVFFTYLGRFAGNARDEFFVSGNAVQVAAMATIFGVVLAMADERRHGMLAPLMATPADRLALFLGRSLPYVANGVIVSTFSFGVSYVLFGFDLEASRIPLLAAVVVTATLSCACLGLMIASIGLRVRDISIATNLAYFGMLLLCGVNVELSALPGWMAAAGRLLPMTHGIEAARKVIAGDPASAVVRLLAIEAAIGAAYGLLGYALFRHFERRARHHDGFERF